MISLKKARKKLDMGDTCIRKTIATDPTFPAYFICGRWKVEVNELDIWINEQKNKAQEENSEPIPVESRSRKKRSRKSTKSVKKTYEVITPGWTPKVGQ